MKRKILAMAAFSIGVSGCQPMAPQCNTFPTHNEGNIAHYYQASDEPDDYPSTAYTSPMPSGGYYEWDNGTRYARPAPSPEPPPPVMRSYKDESWSYKGERGFKGEGCPRSAKNETTTTVILQGPTYKKENIF